VKDDDRRSARAADGRTAADAQRSPAPSRRGPAGPAPRTVGNGAGASQGGLLPTVSLPNGGGAIRGIGEKFSANPATGSGSLSIPIAVSPGRGGVTPALALQYDSGAGNGPFGLGWHLSLPAIARKTDKGLPHYDDDRDVFVLSGAEDLVPVRNAAGNLDVLDRGAYRVQRYRPRVEGLFARIERWRHRSTGDTHWRAITKDNVVSVYGRSADARVADPDDPRRVFSWLLEETRDDRGNLACYRYKAEDGAGVSRRLPEATRYDKARRQFLATAQRYPKRVLYGNRVPVARDQPAPADGDAWMFEVVFDYGEHDDAAPSPGETRPWTVRPDPFSTYRPTFEVRTYRQCRRILVFHRFPELGAEPCLVRSTDLTYAESRVRSADGRFESGPVASYLTSATQAGYRRDPTTGAYERQALPPLDLGYSQPVLHTQPTVVDRESRVGLPTGMAGTSAQFVDLDGEGLPGVLIPSDGAWYYKRNRGQGRFARPVAEASIPAPAALGAGAQQLVDLGGDGNLDLVRYAGPLAGYFERRPPERGGWAPFVALQNLPQIDWNDPNLRFVDLDGDGHPDVLVTEHDAFVWYRAKDGGKNGFEPGRRLPIAANDDDGPRVVYSDPSQAIFLADMSGDGLLDLVRVRYANVSYWPNLGHGRFGRRVVLGVSPMFENQYNFDARRVRLADLDGSGTSDVLYAGKDGIRIYINERGATLSAPFLVTSLPLVHSWATLDVVDLLGTGTGCLVWSSKGPAEEPYALAYVDLLASGKPHLLTSVVNNLGAETRLTYAPSTTFYLADRAAGRAWLTRLPFPVHVLARVEHADHIAGSRLVTRYRYHHGYFDGHEREFGGFACVEQFDAETFTVRGGDDLVQPPVRTVNWFHTGAWLERESLERALSREYYAGDPLAPLLRDTTLPSGLTVREEREAARALRGQILRQEIYADDGTPDAVHPYTVSERDHEIRLVQRAAGSAHAVFFVHPRNTIDVHYERRPADPRVQHAIVLAVDDFGNITESAAISYPRRIPAEPEQARLWSTVTRATFAHRPDLVDDYRVGVPVETITRELTGLVAPTRGVLPITAIQAKLATAVEIPFETDPDPNAPQGQLRVVARQRQRYYADDLSGPLPLGQIDPRALPYESDTLALTPGLVAEAFGDRVDAALLGDEARYVFEDNLWWAPSGRVILDAARFYLPVEAIDPFGHHHTVEYDAHALLVTTATDPLGNRVTAVHDYRVLAPALVTDPNGNRSAAAFDALGMVVATALMGKDGAGEGDTLADPTTRLEYDFHRWRTERKPAFIHTLARERHGTANSRWQETYTYSDGFGREVMTKAQAEPGPVPARGIPDADPRWVGTGRTVFDNKGNRVKQYEPFFSTHSEYEDEADIVESGVTPVLRYDPLGRLIRTDLPDGTHTKAVFDAWRQEAWDGNDSISGTPWLARMQAGTPAEQRAAALSLAHANTPTVSHLDALGRVFLTVADNGPRGLLPTRVALDLQGRPRRITDPRGIVAANHRHDLVGNVLVASLADAGTSRALADVAGKPIRSWNARGHIHRRSYDPLQRPTHLFVRSGTDPEILVERTVYGEAHPDALARNLRDQPYLQLDSAGLARTPGYDFKANPLAAIRRLAIDYHATSDWSPVAGLTDIAAIEAAAEPFLDAETFTTELAYDALSRVTSRTTPDASDTVPTYNDAGLLERIDVRVRGAGDVTPFIVNLDYNARGQRERIAYGNGTVSTYDYEALTFRLTRLRTVRTSGGAVLQDFAYVYDAVGNIVQIADGVSFANAAVSADGFYTYDAIYQLVEAEGREHPGQQPTDADPELLRLDHPEDMQALRRYRERFMYDPAGNIVEMAHVPLGGGPPGWTRAYAYATDSNRLLATSAPGDASGTPSLVYNYDAHGNMIAMPHLSAMRWDHADRLQFADRGGGGIVWFVYDTAGRRVRKIYEHGASAEERVYLAGYEIFRRRRLATGAVELERQTLHVEDGTDRLALVETKTTDAGIPGHVPTMRIRFQLDNHLGSACLEIDDAAQVITYEEYFSYGGTAFRASDSATDVSAKRYRYTGKERDAETGLDYVGLRYYAAWLGRWTSTDPAGLIDGTNLYRYAASNPVVFVDARGTNPKKARKLEETIRTTAYQHELLKAEQEKLAAKVAAQEDKLKAAQDKIDAFMDPDNPEFEKQAAKAETKLKQFRQNRDTITKELTKSRAALTEIEDTLASLDKTLAKAQAKGVELGVQATDVEDAARVLARDEIVDARFEGRKPASKPPSVEPPEPRPKGPSGHGGGHAPGGGPGAGKAAAGAKIATTVAKKAALKAVEGLDIATAKDHDETVVPIILWAVGGEVAVVAGIGVFTYVALTEGGLVHNGCADPHIGQLDICKVEIHPKAPENWRDHMIPGVTTGYVVKESGQILYK